MVRYYFFTPGVYYFDPWSQAGTFVAGASTMPSPAATAPAAPAQPILPKRLGHALLEHWRAPLGMIGGLPIPGLTVPGLEPPIRTAFGRREEERKKMEQAWEARLRLYAARKPYEKRMEELRFRGQILSLPGFFR